MSLNGNFYASAYLLLYNPNDKETYFTERATRMLTQLFLAAREETRRARQENPFAKEIRPLPYVGRLVCLGLNRVAAHLDAVSPPLAEKFLEAEFAPLKDYEESKARSDSWSTLVNRLYPLLTDDILPTFDGCDFTAKDLLFSKDGLCVVTEKKTTIFTSAPYLVRNGRNFSLLNSTPTLNS